MTTDSCSGEINGCCFCPALCCVSSHPAHITCHDALWVPTGLPHRQPVFGSLLRSFKCKHTEYTHTHMHGTKVEEGGFEDLVHSRTHSCSVSGNRDRTNTLRHAVQALSVAVLWTWLMQMMFFFFSFFVYYEQMSEINWWSHLVSQPVQVDTDYIYHFDQGKMKIFLN